MTPVEQIQAIVSIAFERVPHPVRDTFSKAHTQVTVTRVIKETTNLGKVSYDVFFVDPQGQPSHEVLLGAQKRDWSTGLLIHETGGGPRRSILKRKAHPER